jgi:hypothetical protein
MIASIYFFHLRPIGRHAFGPIRKAKLPKPAAQSGQNTPIGIGRSIIEMTLFVLLQQSNLHTHTKQSDSLETTPSTTTDQNSKKDVGKVQHTSMPKIRLLTGNYNYWIEESQRRKVAIATTVARNTCRRSIDRMIRHRTPSGLQ